MPYLIDDSKIADKDYVEYVISCANREIKQDDALTRRILYTALSANTNNPINLGIVAPTSEGKTYPVTKALKYVPNEDVWLVGSMSPKTLFRQNGILVDDKNEALKPKLKDLDKKIEEAEKENNKKTTIELNEQKQDLLENCRYLIDLRGKLLVFLEPPNHELWNMLKAILSHDSYYVEYPFVDRNDKVGIHAKRVVMQGFPACIFCSAKDESDWPDWEQVISRFLICSPNMTVKKYQESNMLIGIRSGLPTCIQEKVVISNAEVGLARECYKYIRDEMRELTKANSPNEQEGYNPVWVPFSDYLAEALPAERGSDVRMAKMIFSFLNVVTLAHVHLRYKLVMGMGIERCTISELADLEEVLRIALDLSGIPTYKVKFLTDDFYPLYDSKSGPDKKDGKEEKLKGVTSRELCYRFKSKYHRPISTDNMKKTYLNELQNLGLIDSVDSEFDHRQKLYYPIVEVPERSFTQEEKITNLSDSSRLDNLFHIPRIRIQNNCRNIPDDWLVCSILGLARYRIDMDHFTGCLADELAQGRDFKIMGKDGTTRLRVCQFISAYEKDRQLSLYCHKPRFSSKVFRIEYVGEVSNGVLLKQTSNSSIAGNALDVKEGINIFNANTKNENSSRAPIMPVEDFFYEDPSLPYKSLPEHELEESPCYAVIGRKSDMYYCKLHPEIQNIHLGDIEHHCKYKEPQVHKSEIQKMEAASNFH
jgi:hypothetical protein